LFLLPVVDRVDCKPERQRAAGRKRPGLIQILFVKVATFARLVANVNLEASVAAGTSPRLPGTCLTKKPPPLGLNEEQTREAVIEYAKEAAAGVGRFANFPPFSEIATF
jgi:hypothetical protein